MKNIKHTFVVLAYKESVYLEDCIKSVLNQKYKSKVVIATSTPNEFIYNLARKYNLKVIVNKGEKGIGNDFDFAIKQGTTDLVTVAHQDDIYDYNYSENIVNKYKKYNDSLILFTDYYEIKNDRKEYKNRNLNIKRILLLPLRCYRFANLKINKRMSLSLGNSICCPSVCFNVKKIKFPVFSSEYKCNVDWNAWEKLSKQDGRFIFINKNLMGHRIHEESTTTEIIKDNIRTKEDYDILQRFWPKPIAKIISKVYAKSENNNNIN